MGWIFLALFPSILGALEGAPNERRLQISSGKLPGSGILATKAMQYQILNSKSAKLRWLNALYLIEATRHQAEARHQNYVFQALESLLQDIRERDWHSISSAAWKASIESSVLHFVGWQHQRSNFEAGTPEKFYKRTLTIPYMDHLISEMDTYFEPNNNAVMSVQAALQYTEAMQVTYHHPRVLMRRFSVGGANGSVWMKDLCSNTIQALEEFDYELFLNMTLLRTFCTSTIHIWTILV